MYSSRGGKSGIFTGIRGCSLRGEASQAFFTGIKGCSLRGEASLAFFTGIRVFSSRGSKSVIFYWYKRVFSSTSSLHRVGNGHAVCVYVLHINMTFITCLTLQNKYNIYVIIVSKYKFYLNSNRTTRRLTFLSVSKARTMNIVFEDNVRIFYI